MKVGETSVLGMCYVPENKHFDVSRIRFASDLMQALSLSRRNKNLGLPLVQAPINFRVMRSALKFSDRWGVEVSGQGDAYVYCRDNPNAEKVSLHTSGRQHISIRSDVAKSEGGFPPSARIVAVEAESMHEFRHASLLDGPRESTDR